MQARRRRREREKSFGGGDEVETGAEADLAEAKPSLRRACALIERARREEDALHLGHAIARVVDVAEVERSRLIALPA